MTPEKTRLIDQLRSHIQHNKDEIERLQDQIEALTQIEKNLSEPWYEFRFMNGGVPMTVRVDGEKPSALVLQKYVEQDPNAIIAFGRGRFEGMNEYVSDYLTMA